MLGLMNNHEQSAFRKERHGGLIYQAEVAGISVARDFWRANEISQTPTWRQFSSDRLEPRLTTSRFPGSARIACLMQGLGALCYYRHDLFTWCLVEIP